MAILQNTLIGRAKRSIGGVTFSTWKGLNVGKSKPVSVANPNTPKQIMRRSALAQIVAVFRQIPSAVNVGFAKLAIHKSPYNAFSGLALKDAFTYTAPPVADLQYGLLLVAKGTMQTTPILTAVADVSVGSVAVTFSNLVAGVGQSLTDTATLVVFNDTTKQWHSAVGATQRSSGEIDIARVDFPFAAGDEIYTYLFFKSETTGEVSDSVFIDVVAVA